MESTTKSSAAYEAQASSIFSFLRVTFSQMPRPVQVIGWLILLLVFVILVLHPLLGVTYFEGRVTTLAWKESGEPTSRWEPNLRVERNRHTYTNEGGQFIIPVRVPYVPFVDVEFHFGVDDIQELVSLPRPIPFVSLFNPNESKIYYVPSSKTMGPLGTPQRFFVDHIEARKAFESSQEKPTPTPPSIATLLSRLTIVNEAAAAALRFQQPTYTLRIDEILLDARESAYEIFFKILVDGNEIMLDSVPNAESPKIDQFTIFSGIPFRFDALGIPLIGAEHRIEISAWSAGIFRDSQLGSLVFDLDKSRVGQEFREIGEGLEVNLKLFPAVSIDYIMVPTIDDNAYLAINWLDIPKEYLGSVRSVVYDHGLDAENRFQTITRNQQAEGFSWFSTNLLINAALDLKAEISFEIGTVILARTLVPESKEPTSQLGYSFVAKALRLTGQHEQALDAIKLVLGKTSNLPEALTEKGKILAELGRIEDAFESFQRAHQLDPSNSAGINAYAWFLIETVPNPTRAQLQRGKELAEIAVKISPDAPRLDTLGWANFKLGEYKEAVDLLTTARDLRSVISQVDSIWIELQYHLGETYLAINDPERARAALNDVVELAQPDYFPGVPYILELAERAEELLATLAESDAEGV